MDLVAALAADLAELSRAIGDPAVDLEADLLAVMTDVHNAVPSYLGLRLTMTVEGRRLSFATYADGAHPSATCSSLRLPLDSVAGTDGGSSMVFYAATPGAFVDLAADLAYALQLDPSDVVLDDDEVDGGPSRGIDGLTAWSEINRAIGVLIGRGHTTESAHDELRRLADPHGGDLRDAAASVLATARRPEPGPGES